MAASEHHVSSEVQKRGYFPSEPIRHLKEPCPSSSQDPGRFLHQEEEDGAQCTAKAWARTES